MTSLEQAFESIEKNFHVAKGGREDRKECAENGIGREGEDKEGNREKNEYLYIKLYIAALRRRGPHNVSPDPPVPMLQYSRNCHNA